MISTSTQPQLHVVITADVGHPCAHLQCSRRRSMIFAMLVSMGYCGVKARLLTLASLRTGIGVAESCHSVADTFLKTDHWTIADNGDQKRWSQSCGSCVFRSNPATIPAESSQGIGVVSYRPLMQATDYGFRRRSTAPENSGSNCRVRTYQNARTRSSRVTDSRTRRRNHDSSSALRIET